MITNELLVREINRLNKKVEELKEEVRVEKLGRLATLEAMKELKEENRKLLAWNKDLVRKLEWVNRTLMNIFDRTQGYHADKGET